ncbi:MAG: protein-glutamate O-methyltransferase CheR [Euryarchaeota archaeon]|nr:protein-glutamate O-methyltransferase CheR [Euryarchaeota archaeon]
MIAKQDYFPLLRRRIKEIINFNSDYYEEKHLRRRVAIRMRALDMSSYREYLKLLERSPEERERLMRVLTVNVTEFFRNPETFVVIHREVLPELIRMKEENGSRVLRIWSAGCASGEEPYSLAMLVKENLGSRRDFRVRIMATDIDRDSLEKAKRGEYLEKELLGVAREYIRKYFERRGEVYRIKRELREMVTFERRDLISDRKYGAVDLILCRNVIIYFSRELKEKLFMDFYESLNPRGFLVLGKTENLSGEARKKFKIYNNVERIYRKEVGPPSPHTFPRRY